MGRCFSVFLILTIITITLATATLAASGCFLEPESEEYCNEITQPTAEFECSLYDSCNLESSFQENKECSLYDECEEILCQSSCEYEIAGLCSSGPVPAGEEDLWCSSEGCCQWWPDSSEPGCQIEENKWSCHITANNAGAQDLNWDQSLDQSTCEDVCLAQSYPYTAKLDDYELEFYSQENSQTQDEDNTEDTNQDSAIDELTTKVELISEGDDILAKVIDLLAPFFLIFIIFLIFIFFYEHRHAVIKDYNLIMQKLNKTKQRTNHQENTGSSLHSKKQTAKPSIAQELVGLHPRHKHSRKRQHAQMEMAESFAEFKSTELPAKTGMARLQRMVKKQERKSSRRKRSKENLAKKLK